MTDRLPQSMIEEARHRRPLSVIIGSVILLRRIGRELEGICPFHNDHRPSLNVNDAKAAWLCRVCGEGGDAITFLERYKRVPFIEAVKELANAPHESSTSRFMRRLSADIREYGDAAANGTRWEPDADQRRNMAEAIALWGKSSSAINSPAHVYLQWRGYHGKPPESLRFLPSEPYWMVPEGRKRAEIIGHHPVLIAAVRNSTNSITAVQRTYLRDDGKGKAAYDKTKKVLGPLHDGAVRLGKPGRILGLSEGIETGLAAQQIFSVPVWAVLGNRRFTLVRIPSTVEQLVIFADNGKDGRVDPVALEAAEEYDHRGTAVVIEAPEGVKDWADVLAAKVSAA